MTDESKTDDIEAKLATLRGRNELSNAKLENLSDRELDSFNKQTLVFLAGLFNITYSGLISQLLLVILGGVRSTRPSGRAICLRIGDGIGGGFFR